MAEKTSVVTPERYASGFTYEDYISQIKVNKDRFQTFYETAELSEDDVAFFKKVGESHKMMVIGEDWCPDVFRGMPLMAKIAEVGGMEMRIFPRDENLDLMNEFLKDGEFLSIPVAVFYTEDLEEVGRWIERPVIGYEEGKQIGEDTRREMPDADETEVRKVIRDRNYARYPDWQKASVVEMREILSKKLNI